MGLSTWEEGNVPSRLEQSQFMCGFISILTSWGMGYWWTLARQIFSFSCTRIWAWCLASTTWFLSTHNPGISSHSLSRNGLLPVSRKHVTWSLYSFSSTMVKKCMGLAIPGAQNGSLLPFVFRRSWSKSGYRYLGMVINEGVTCPTSKLTFLWVVHEHQSVPVAPYVQVFLSDKGPMDCFRIESCVH